MGWMETIALVCVLLLLLYLGYEWGRMDQRKHQEAREEAIRAQAYKDGRKSMFDQIVSSSGRGLWPAQTTEDFRRMYATTRDIPTANDTKESS
jgi:1,4-alpha-glucan branching enzyme